MGQPVGKPPVHGRLRGTNTPEGQSGREAGRLCKLVDGLAELIRVLDRREEQKRGRVDTSHSLRPSNFEAVIAVAVAVLVLQLHGCAFCSA
jgi:hypothetical protein